MSTDSSPSSAEDLLQAFSVNTLTTDNLVVAFVGAERALLERVQRRAVASAQGVDTTDLALKLGGDRLLLLVQMHEKLGRTLRLTIALKRRIETGWPRRGEADDRRAMARRQVERSVGDKIRAERGEAAERLLRELHERLWDPGVEAMLDSMPIEDVIAAIAREFAAVKTEVDAWVPPPLSSRGMRLLLRMSLRQTLTLLSPG